MTGAAALATLTGFRPKRGDVQVFVHLGGDVVVATRDVVAIIDVSAAGNHPAAARALETARRSHGYRELEGGKVKALVVTTKGTFGSPISPGTLRRRAIDYVQREGAADSSSDCEGR